MRLRVHVAFVFLSVLTSLPDAAGYDYSEPMRCVSVLPLGYPESPFVLRFGPEELQSQPIWGSGVDGIVISTEAEPPIRTGAEALRSTLRRLGMGEAALIEVEPTESTLPATITGDRVIILGVPGRFALATALANQADLDVTDESLNGDGFIIKPLQEGPRELLLIVSPVSRGVLYGTFELEERLSTRGVPRIDQCFVPAVRYRGWPLHMFVDEPRDAIGRWRLNISMASDWWGASSKSLLFYREFPELGGERYREQILQQQQRLHDKYANAVLQGAMPAITWNPLSFSLTPGAESQQAYQEMLSKAHPGILAQPFSSEMASVLGNDRKNLCPSHPDTRRYVESAVREFVETFPEIEIMNFMLSDVGGEVTCGCDACKDYPYLDRLADYAGLIVRTARDVKPTIRFMTCPSALAFFIPIHHPEFKGNTVAALKALKTRLGDDVEAFLLSVGSPPGGDCQSWLAPDCSMLNQGVPLFSFFQHYEADGPGIASPISPILGYLSWSLPIHLRTMQRYADGGMIGAMVQGAGVEVGCWYPDLDGYSYMRNWCHAKYGREAGQDVFEALQSTHTITEAFYLDTKPDCIESVDFYRWGSYCKPWAIDMSTLKNAGLTEGETAGVMANIVLAFTMPQAPQPDGLRRVTVSDQGSWLKRFEMAEAIAIADRSEQSLAKALTVEPGNAEIHHLHELAKSTQSLVQFFKEYHEALVYANSARNTTDQEIRRIQTEFAREHLKAAIARVVDYRDRFLPLVRSQSDTLGSLKLCAPVKYVGNFLGILREATYLFDQEFGGESLLSYMDQRVALSGS